MKSSAQRIKLREITTKQISLFNKRIIPDCQGDIFKRTKEQILQDTLKAKEEKIKKKNFSLAMLKEEQRKVEQSLARFDYLQNDMGEQ
ncbi:hypothetical protein TTHERM_001469343 (macronuclear) [Tetrahymena thermophila SB210]|uniref:Uncharacterized protein n=1 Tax=Tetrahymena thermophila (strain SB210) TaxID=312017 RepID=W7XC76_TETTS|nr:hypothetical protein TTHERM_001469343 [Tetrahymena thermophila SB210]EWS74123.1 hypothetical protein TTHERM_001469343 [Tetrahymena thermophila SB210]|eukprot:XP_012653344.1 hypothetical protein TTHERM_001469343 [Tetrahymena thermophila SB210]